MADSSNKTKIFIFGAQGQAKMALNIVKKTPEQWSFSGNITTENEEAFLAEHHENTAIFIALGENWTRQEIYQKTKDKGFTFPPLIHPSALVASDVSLGQGTIVMPGAIINTGSTIGDFCVINSGSIVEHDCHIDDFCSVAPGAVICGSGQIKKGAYIGANATISQNLTIGEWSVIGAGGVVINPIAPNTINVGVPTKEIAQKKKSDTVLL